MSRGRRTAPRRPVVALAAVGALAVLAGGSMLMWASADDASTAAPAPAPATGAPTTTPVPVVGSPAPSGGHALPATLTIPSIDVRVPVGRLGLQDDGTVQVPSDAEDVGWYRLGPRPGARGSAVLLGHRDSTTGPAVFYRLSELRAGDRISVGLADGSVVAFEVRTVRTYANADFPARRVYRASGPSQLTLVTCGGDYDSSRGGYQANVVVSSRRV